MARHILHIVKFIKVHTHRQEERFEQNLGQVGRYPKFF